MKKTAIYLALLFATMPAAVVAAGYQSQNAPTSFSNKGQIQNVQNYSTNPFWSPNSPYNQRMPIPIHAKGTDLNAADCQSIVGALVADQCSMKNNCVGARVADIRPAIMIQLSKMQGYNYVTACNGFIDSAFNDHVAKYGNAVSNERFPNASGPANNMGNQPNFKIENPYEKQNWEWGTDEWYKNYGDRENELDRLQSLNAEDYSLQPTSMPKTIADVSFQDRMDNAAAGYEQWKDKAAYQQVGVESMETYWQRQANIAEERKRYEDAMKQMGAGNQSGESSVSEDWVNKIAEALRKAKK